MISQIKNAFSKIPGPDDQLYPQGTASYNKKDTKFNRLLPYGLSVLEPKDTFILLLSQKSVKFGIPSAMENRFKNLQEGEVVLYNSLEKSYIYLKSDGSIEVNGDLVVKNNLTVSGSVTVSGDVTVSGNVTIGGISFLDHVHSGVTTGSGQSGPPVP